MKDEAGRGRAARAGCVMRKHWHLLLKANLLSITLSWLGGAKPSGLIVYYKTLSFTLPFGLIFFHRNPSLIMFLVWLYCDVW